MEKDYRITFTLFHRTVKPWFALDEEMDSYCGSFDGAVEYAKKRRRKLQKLLREGSSDLDLGWVITSVVSK